MGNVNFVTGSVNELTTKINARMERYYLPLVQALLATSDGRDIITLMLVTVGKWAKYAAAASAFVDATVTLFGTDAVSHFKKVAQEMSTSLKELCDVAAVFMNLAHEEIFPQGVYGFVSDQASVASFGCNPEGTNNEDLMRRIQALGEAESGPQRHGKSSRPILPRVPSRNRLACTIQQENERKSHPWFHWMHQQY
jgi:hypothetical protein